MYKNKKTFLVGLSNSDYSSLKAISDKFDTSIVEAVRIAIRSYDCLSSFYLEQIKQVRSELQELIQK